MRYIHTEGGETMIVCRIQQYCYSFLLGFNRISVVYMHFSTSWYGYRYHVLYALVTRTSLQSIRLVVECALFWYWESLCGGDYHLDLYVHCDSFCPTHLGFRKLDSLGLLQRTSLMLRSLNLVFECWNEHVTLRLYFVMFTFFTRTFYMGVPGVATDFPCCVWCRGLTIYLLHVGPIFGNLVRSDTGFVNLTQWRITLSLSLIYVCTHTFKYMLWPTIWK